jgi:hypothetical protein
MLDDTLTFGLAISYLALSNLLAGVLLYYLNSRPAVNQSIITHLNTTLVGSYNFGTSLLSLGLMLRSSLGPLPPSAAAAFFFLLRIGFFNLVGLHIAIAIVRYLIVISFSWIQAQDYHSLGHKINFVIGIASLFLTMVFTIFRQPATADVDVEFYLSGQAAVHRAKLHWFRIFISGIIILIVSICYIVSKWILLRRMAVSVQPSSAQGRTHALIRHINAKSILTGSFYPFACYAVAALLDQVPGLQEGNSMAVAILHVNTCVLVFLVCRPRVLSYFRPKIRKTLARLSQFSWSCGRNSRARSISVRGPRPVFTDVSTIGDIFMVSNLREHRRAVLYVIPYNETDGSYSADPVEPTVYQSHM